ncbi:hypothetical protein CLOP_g19456, partial [Closterium sp. NIES-67]
LQQGASKGSVLRVVWQACWLQQQQKQQQRQRQQVLPSGVSQEHGEYQEEEQHRDRRRQHWGDGEKEASGSSSSSSGGGSSGSSLLKASLDALASEFEGFLAMAAAAGWDTNTLVAKVPLSAPLLILQPQGIDCEAPEEQPDRRLTAAAPR